MVKKFFLAWIIAAISTLSLIASDQVIIDDLKRSMILDASCVINLLDSLRAMEIAQVELESIIRDCSLTNKEIVREIENIIVDHIDQILAEFNEFICFVLNREREIDARIVREQQEGIALQHELIKDLQLFYRLIHNQLQERRRDVQALDDTYLDYSSQTTQEISSLVNAIETTITQEYNKQAELLIEEYSPFYKQLLSMIRSTKKFDVMIQSSFLQSQLAICTTLTNCLQYLNDQFASFNTIIQHQISLLRAVGNEELKEQLSAMMLLIAKNSDAIVTDIRLSGTKAYMIYQDIDRLINTIHVENITEMQEQRELITLIQSDLCTRLCDQDDQIVVLLQSVVKSLNDYIETSYGDIVHRIKVYGETFEEAISNLYTSCSSKIHTLDQAMKRCIDTSATNSMKLCHMRMQVISALASKQLLAIQKQEYTHLNQLLCLDGEVSQQICSKIMMYMQHQVIGNNLISRLIQSAYTMITDLVCQKISHAQEQLTEQNIGLNNDLTDTYTALSTTIAQRFADLNCQLAQISSRLCSKIMVIESDLKHEIIVGISQVTTDITIQNNGLLEQLTTLKTDLHALIGLKIQEHDIHMTKQFEHKCKKLMDAINAENEGTESILSRIQDLEDLVLEDIDSFIDCVDEYTSLLGKYTVMLVLIAAQLASIAVQLAALLAEDVAMGG